MVLCLPDHPPRLRPRTGGAAQRGAGVSVALLYGTVCAERRTGDHRDRTSVLLVRTFEEQAGC